MEDIEANRRAGKYGPVNEYGEWDGNHRQLSKVEQQDRMRKEKYRHHLYNDPPQRRGRHGCDEDVPCGSGRDCHYDPPHGKGRYCHDPPHGEGRWFNKTQEEKDEDDARKQEKLRKEKAGHDRDLKHQEQLVAMNVRRQEIVDAKRRQEALLANTPEAKSLHKINEYLSKLDQDIKVVRKNSKMSFFS
jgi:hypothetical protein